MQGCKRGVAGACCAVERKPQPSSPRASHPAVRRACCGEKRCHCPLIFPGAAAKLSTSGSCAPSPGVCKAGQASRPADLPGCSRRAPIEQHESATPDLRNGAVFKAAVHRRAGGHDFQALQVTPRGRREKEFVGADHRNGLQTSWTMAGSAVGRQRRFRAGDRGVLRLRSGSIARNSISPAARRPPSGIPEFCRSYFTAVGVAAAIGVDGRRVFADQLGVDRLRQRSICCVGQVNRGGWRCLHLAGGDSSRPTEPVAETIQDSWGGLQNRRIIQSARRAAGKNGFCSRLGPRPRAGCTRRFASIELPLASRERSPTSASAVSRVWIPGRRTRPSCADRRFNPPAHGIGRSRATGHGRPL